MTTITNFLHSNFVHSGNTSQLPIWVLTGSRALRMHTLRRYLIDTCLNNQKSLVHVDLGVSTLPLIVDAEVQVELAGGIKLYMPRKADRYYIIAVDSHTRDTQPDCLLNLLGLLPGLTSRIAALHHPNTPATPHCLFLEGLELISSLSQLQAGLQPLINYLPALGTHYQQVSIFKHRGSLRAQHQFYLQRISTCLTEVEKFEPAGEGAWLVRSTVRRHTGFSKEERYWVRLSKGRAKVEKHSGTKEAEETQLQRQMLSELGFQVKKSDDRQELGLKRMIYPHLRVQGGCGEGQGGCEGGQCCHEGQSREGDEGLIVLDDEQEDDDDIDV